MIDVEALTPSPLHPFTPLSSALQVAAERLLAAREILYPVTIHLIDLHLVAEERPHSICPILSQATNVIAAASFLTDDVRAGIVGTCSTSLWSPRSPRRTP